LCPALNTSASRFAVQERVNRIPKAKEKLHGCWRDLPEKTMTSTGKPLIPE
jgi:hypothetical protein